MKIYETLDSGIKIVEYEPSLAASLADMWNVSADDWGGAGSLQTEAQIIANHETAANINVYVALDGDMAVGYCSFGRYWADADTLYIPLLGVRTGYKNKKIGKALVLRCVQRTIELGYARLDLHTWSGNTAAVPLYKKCGFMWEDRPDSTHLANYVPEIVTTPTFAAFFENADWYDYQVRNMDIAPDGAKINNFELFMYKWVKGDDMLQVGYERTGRSMYYLENNDYKIELMAQDHTLAAGVNYTCSFAITNKSGKPLDIKIAGKTNANISLDYTHHASIEGEVELHTTFHVGNIVRPQDLWRVHPCIEADVTINGETLRFGLGIEAKLPLTIKLTRLREVDIVGMSTACHVDIESALLSSASIKITIPQGELLKFEDFPQVVEIAANGKASVSTTTTVLGIGHEVLQAECEVSLPNGKLHNMQVPIYVASRNLTHAFVGEDLHNHYMCNGMWQFIIEKSGSDMFVLNSVQYMRDALYLDPPKLGKPYDDEFNLIEPTVTMYQRGAAMVAEVKFVSQKFPGMEVVQVVELYQNGMTTTYSRITNTSPKEQAVMLLSGFGFDLENKITYSRNGKIMQNGGEAFPDIYIEGFYGDTASEMDENWIFEAGQDVPRGYCWPKEYKPSIKWGNYVLFDIDPGTIAPGQTVETGPIACAYGVFLDYVNFRNFAMQVQIERTQVPTTPVEIELNAYNPFAAPGDSTLTVHHNRRFEREGTVRVAVGDKTYTQVNDKEYVEQNKFDISIGSDTLQLVTVNMEMSDFINEHRRVVFVPQGQVNCVQDGTNYSVSNGAITFMVDPSYSHGCYSLKDASGQEWLLSMYPNHAPHSWYNPFFGGVIPALPNFNNVSLIKEDIGAKFVKLTDNCGNVWQGVCSTLSIKKDDKLKGLTVETYFLTMPGLPVLCTFIRVRNNSGAYMNKKVYLETFMGDCGDAKAMHAHITDKSRQTYHLHSGVASIDDVGFDSVATITSQRAEKFYYVHGGYNNSNDISGDNDVSYRIDTSIKTAVAHGKEFASAPTFIVVSAQDIPQNAFADFKRLKFD